MERQSFEWENSFAVKSANDGHGEMNNNLACGNLIADSAKRNLGLSNKGMPIRASFVQNWPPCSCHEM